MPSNADGRFRGELQLAGGYVYVIKAKTFCGNINAQVRWYW